MKKLFVNPFELIPGMKIAETILNNYGAIVISEGTILDEHLVNKLRGMNLYRIQVFDEDYEKNQLNAAFKEDYDDNVNKYKEIINGISNGEDISVTKVDKVVDSVLQKFEEKRDIVSCLNQIKSADEYTYTHSVNVSLISMLIGKWMKLSPEKIKLLVQAALLHDIGKTKVPIEILNKPGKLTQNEFAQIKMHSIYGYRILEKVPSISKDVLAAVLMHHEKEDGSGYPTGLSGDKIHIFAKVVSVADIYDAMTSNRVYREKESPFEVFRLMEENSIGTLNPVVVNAFLSNIAAYYIGDRVRFVNGEEGEIIHINPRCVSKPIVRIGEKYIDMLSENDIKIKEII